MVVNDSKTSQVTLRQDWNEAVSDCRNGCHCWLIVWPLSLIHRLWGRSLHIWWCARVILQRCCLSSYPYHPYWCGCCTPWSLLVKAWLVNWFPWSVLKISGVPCREIALSTALMQKELSVVLDNCQQRILWLYPLQWSGRQSLWTSECRWYPWPRPDWDS